MLAADDAAAVELKRLPADDAAGNTAVDVPVVF